MIGAIGHVGRLGLSVSRRPWTPLRLPVMPVLGVDAAITSNLVLSGNSVSQWSSIIGPALVQATGSAQLAYESAGFGNYAPCLASDGGDWMQATIPGLRNFTAIDVYMVLQTSVATGADVFSLNAWAIFVDLPTTHAWVSNVGALAGETIAFAYGNGLRLGSNTYTRAANTPQMLNTKNSTAGTELFSNGSAITLNLASGMTTSTNTSPASLGLSVDTFYLFSNGGTVTSPAAKIKELWVIPSILSAADRQLMEGYLAHNNWRIYGQPVPLPSSHPYFSAPPY